MYVDDHGISSVFSDICLIALMVINTIGLESYKLMIILKLY